MISRLMTSTAIVALTIVTGTCVGLAQGAGDPAPPPAETTPPAVATPPVTTAPPATQGTPPASATPPQAGQGQQLPDVEVIQQQPKPPKPQPAQAAAKPKPKPVAVAPTPQGEPVAPTTPVIGVATTAGPPSFDTPVRMSPVGGSEIPLDKVPTSVGAATAEDISKDGSGQIQQTLQTRVPGVILTDIAGSGFRQDVSYRGFDASPIGGRAQGLAVYQNGVRINESFGDAVNLDLIPSNAIQDITVISGNPVFGLNAIGGAISIVTKDGFNYHGGELDTMFGSFGRRQAGLQAGGSSGGVGVYAAGEYLADDGFRDFSDAEIKRFFADLGFKSEGAEFHVNLTAAKSSAGVTTAAPVELLREDYSNTFTSPQNTDIEVLMPTVNGRVDVTETLSFSGVAYYRHFKQNVVDGNLSEVEACSFDDSVLCLTNDGVEAQLLDAGGAPITTPDGPIGSIERINTDAESFGGSLQAVDKSRLFDRPNQILVGVSYDRGNVSYTTSSEVGTIGRKFVVTGTGSVVSEPDDLAPRNVAAQNDYYGVYFSDTFDLTDALAVTVGGRYNYARIELEDLTGDFDELTTTNDYERFNPTAGATYKLMQGLSIYGNYSEANRAPTAAELSCADPDNPCIIESFLTDDPPLKQVVSRSWEAGVRGESKSWDNQRFNWGVGYFRTLNTDDILNVAATTSGRGYFLNAGDTLREGFEASAGYQNDRLQLYASYTLVNATFRDDLVLAAPNTPDADLCPGADPTDDDAPTCNFVEAGDHLPGIPRHRFKTGFDYWLTPQWKFGADLVAASGQFFFGDEANNNRQLAGYTRVDLHSSYDITQNVQVYGLIKNAFDRRYGLYGTFFDPAQANEASDATGVVFSDDERRSITPAPPFAAYGGVKIKF